ncbi:putative syntaxin [Cyclospora cayetanensis]|uniref:Syntaxin n=1 Tax=Cyclospora cayetanensis TaxID=88456 RepID=A0A1D3CS71_9EIME|nr:putative syntaxin [Cyclospora cayetanensis]
MGYDRTHEFVEAAERLGLSGGSERAEQRRHFSDTDQQFNALAAEMGNALHSTSLKLQELGKLARQCGIYNDKTAQIQELTFEIRKTINVLNHKTDLLAKLGANVGGGSGHSRQHYVTVTEVLKTRLLDVTKEFKDILTLRTENLKRQDRRRNLYSFGGESGTADADDGIFDVEGGQRVALVSRQGHSYAQSRAEAVENVQRVIGELASIFQRVATMITHQEEMIQRIDQDLDSSMTHIREGQSELLNFYNRISSNRTLIVFLMLMAFILFFVFFLS